MKIRNSMVALLAAVMLVSACGNESEPAGMKSDTSAEQSSLQGGNSDNSEETAEATAEAETTPPQVPESDINDFAIEDGVLKKYIGKSDSVGIPQGVTSIGEEAFHNC